MQDIVQEALDQQEEFEPAAETQDDEFGVPTVCLIGYGTVGAKIVQEGWDDRYPHPKYPDVETCQIHQVDALPEKAIVADYVILTGSVVDHGLAAGIGGALADDTTSIAIPIHATENSIRTVGTANATIPCKHEHVQELATDLLTLLTARMEISPSIRFYQELQYIGRLRAFRGELNRDSTEMQLDEFAAQLVDDALMNPLDTGGSNTPDHYMSFLHTGDAVTHREADAVRDTLFNQLGVGFEHKQLVVDVRTEMRNTPRLLVLCV